MLTFVIQDTRLPQMQSYNLLACDYVLRCNLNFVPTLTQVHHCLPTLVSPHLYYTEAVE
jgi:hypothetical protein